MGFKTWLEADEEQWSYGRGVFGNFKDLPEELQPQRIPLSVFPQLAKRIYELLVPHGRVFIPDAVKKSAAKDAQEVGDYFKDSTSDVDVFFLPNERDYKDTIRRLFNIVVDKSQDPQFFAVVKGLVDNNKYMLDIRRCTTKEWKFITFHHGYGVILPVVLGSFARSLKYKFANDGLYKRLQDTKGNFHNLFLTNDPSVAMQILGLDPNIDPDDFYSPEKAARWVIDSTRFDSRRWNAFPDESGITIKVKNNASHRSAVKRTEVQRAYEIIDRAQKTSNVENDNFEIERAILGDAHIEKMLDSLRRKTPQMLASVLDGNEIMQILNLRPSPEVGRWVRYLNNHPKLQGINVSSPQAKELAKSLLINAQRQK